MSQHLLGWAACKYYGPCLHVWQQLLPVLAECETSEPLATAGQFSAPGEPSLNHTVLWLQAMLVLCTRSLAEELYWQMVQTPAPATTTFKVSNCPTDRENQHVHGVYRIYACCRHANRSKKGNALHMPSTHYLDAGIRWKQFCQLCLCLAHRYNVVKALRQTVHIFINIPAADLQSGVPNSVHE